MAPAPKQPADKPEQNDPAEQPGAAKASDLPDPNPHAAGQTPAGETDQPDYSPGTNFADALGRAQLALSNIAHDQSQPSTDPDALQPVIDALEDALKAAKAHMKSGGKS